MEGIMPEKPLIRISVRNLVEFILRSGSLDSRHASGGDNAMAEGSRVHRMIQRRMGADYHAEMLLRFRMECEEYDILVEGRADGVITGSEETTIDEIKGTYQDIGRMKAAVPVHLAQVKCYAYMYASEHGLQVIKVQMTYCHLETEELRYFREEYTYAELRGWFEEVMEQYKKWADFEFNWKRIRQDSIKELTFPFDYRIGQKELITYVYQTIYHRKKLFIEAPTGVGKTISTVFPAVKAMGEDKGDKLFYLTAKTITRTVANNTFQLLRENGLRLKTVELTAKEKVCFMEETECNPDACPYAKGHYDRVNDAMYALLQAEDAYTREKLEACAKEHQVCPFELCLDMSLFSDAIVCDYNYLFDPHVYLKRFFADGIQADYLFLVDEAHNLVDRGREMYSAVLRKEDFLQLKKTVKPFDVHMERQLEKCNKELLLLKRECETYRVVEFISPFVMVVNRLFAAMDTFLQEHDDSPIRKEVLDFYFEIAHFLDIYERVDDKYVMYTELESDGSFILKLLCVDPSSNLKECMRKGRSTILFSATLLPIQYYKRLLGGEASDYEVYVESTFDPRRKALYIASDVTSKYTRRTDLEFYQIASYLYEIVKNRHGNYLIFFPSHAFLQTIYNTFTECYHEEWMECIVQSDRMNEEEREAFLNRFTGNRECDLAEVIRMDVEIEQEHSLLGFCVMGGIFGEGIDLKEDSLIGAIIVGTGLPQVCNERELLKQYFDDHDEDGFAYAYRYPGMNKVLQAAGRVIRTAEDVGIIALLDERFLQGSYRKMFPKEWEDFEIVTKDKVGKRVERFWDEWL